MEEMLTQERQAEVAHARAVDEAIAQAWDHYWEAETPRRAAAKQVTEAEGRVRRAEARGDDRRAQQAEASAQFYREVHAPLAEQAAERMAAAVALDRATYGGWTRFYRVQHIHSSQRCSSFRPTTRIGWLPDVSGLTEAEAVAAHGAILCTICFPTAPVAWTRGLDADPSTCPGSGKFYDDKNLTGRERAHFSPTGRCGTCGEVVGLASRGSIKVRKHKIKEA